MRESWLTLAGVLIFALGGSAGCSDFADADDLLGDEQLGSEAQQNPALLGVDAWRCLGTATGQDVVTNGRGEGQVTLRIPFHDQLSQQPVTDLEVRACSGTDIACTAPVVDWSSVGPDGRWVGLVPWGFFGYVEVRGEGQVPSVNMIDTPVRRDLELYSHAVVQPEVVDSILGVLGLSWEREASGLVVASVRDCSGQTSPGVQVSLDGSEIPFALDNGVPVLNQDVSLADGNVGYINVAAGVRSLRAAAPDGTQFDTAGIIVRPGWFTSTYLRPIVYSAEELCTEAGARPGFYSVQTLEVCDSKQPSSQAP